MFHSCAAIKSSIQDPDNIKCGSKKHDVTLEDLTSLLGKSPLTLRLIDVREPKDIEETGRIPTSINVPRTSPLPSGFKKYSFLDSCAKFA